MISFTRWNLFRGSEVGMMASCMVVQEEGTEMVHVCYICNMWLQSQDAMCQVKVFRGLPAKNLIILVAGTGKVNYSKLRDLAVLS